MYFKEPTSASEKLPRVAFPLLPGREIFFQLSCPVATTVIFFPVASCHPSILTGLVAEAWSQHDRGQALWSRRR